MLTTTLRGTLRHAQNLCSPVRDEEAAGSNPVTPTSKPAGERLPPDQRCGTVPASTAAEYSSRGHSRDSPRRRSASQVAFELALAYISIVTATSACRSTPMITRGWTSRSTRSVAQVLRASWTRSRRMPAAWHRAVNRRFRSAGRRGAAPAGEHQPLPQRSALPCLPHGGPVPILLVSSQPQRRPDERGHRQHAVRRLGLRLAEQQSAAYALELEVNGQLPLLEVHRPRQAEYLAPSSARGRGSGRTPRRGSRGRRGPTRGSDASSVDEAITLWARAFGIFTSAATFLSTSSSVIARHSANRSTPRRSRTVRADGVCRQHPPLAQHRARSPRRASLPSVQHWHSSLTRFEPRLDFSDAPPV